MEAITLIKGAEVYSDDEIKLGNVKRVFSAAPEAVPLSPAGRTSQDGDDDRNSAGPWAAEENQLEGGELAVTFAQGTSHVVDTSAPMVDIPRDLAEEQRREAGRASGLHATIGPSDTKYLEVHHGGFLHHGGTSLYVPYNAIKLIEDDGSILLSHTAAEATRLFSRHPLPLDVPQPNDVP